MMFKKTAIWALLLACVTVLASCGGDKNNGSGTTAATTPDRDSDTVETGESLDLPDVQFDSDIRIFLKNGDYASEVKPEEGDSVVSAAVFSRNSVIEETYNVTLLFTQSLLEYNTDALNVLQSGTDVYDFMQCHGRAAYVYAGLGLAMDWNEFRYISLDKPWWNSSAREALTIAGKLPAMTGELGYSTIGGGIGMVFNKSLFNAKDYTPEYFFDMVDEGTWTFDTFYNLVTDMKNDLNGDGVIDFQNDQLGYGTSQWGGPIQLIYMTGSKVITNNDDGVPEFSFYNDKTIDIYERYFKLIRSDGAYCELSDKGENVQAAWSTGRVAFMQTSMENLGSAYFLDSSVNFGLIPLPKYDKEVSKYYSGVDASSTLFVIPATVPAESHEMIGVVLEAMAYYGREYIIPAYYNKTLASRYVKDPDSYRMLDYIYDGCCYDLGYYNSDEFGGKFASIGYMLARNAEMTFTSYYRENFEAAREKLQASYLKYAGEEL